MNDNIIRMNAGSIPTFDGGHQFKAYGYFSGFGDAINDDWNPNLLE